jgi:DNA-binding FadR family transcriptional regulator
MVTKNIFHQKIYDCINKMNGDLVFAAMTEHMIHAVTDAEKLLEHLKYMED